MHESVLFCAKTFSRYTSRAGNDGCNELCYTGIRGIFLKEKSPVGIKSCKLYL